MHVMPLRRAVCRVSVTARAVVGAALSYAFGRTECIGCGAECLWRPLCARCARQVVEGFGPPGARRCRVCGKPLVSEEAVCMRCRTEPVLVHTDVVLPLFPYRLWRKSLLLAWKLEGERSLSPVFAAAAARALGMLCPGGAGDGGVPLVPVPPRPGKVRAQGWDQVQELCALLDGLYGYTVLPLLCRRSAVQQKGLSRGERLAAGAGAYALSGSCARVLGRWRRRCGPGAPAMPGHVVLVDDVITTGATAECCASLLTGLGIRKVTVLSLLIVD